MIASAAARVMPSSSRRAFASTFEPAAVRWLARLALEGREIGPADLQLAAAALGSLRTRRHETAEKTLLRLL
jgi:hypothetical protein